MNKLRSRSILRVSAMTVLAMLFILAEGPSLPSSGRGGFPDISVTTTLNTTGSVTQIPARTIPESFQPVVTDLVGHAERTSRLTARCAPCRLLLAGRHVIEPLFRPERQRRAAGKHSHFEWELQARR